ncbi:GNAT family N-acetyltransferase [Actinomycetes bacterium NPDC127524]
MKIEIVHEYDISIELSSKIEELLNDSFPEIYPENRIYFKQLPHFRFLAYNQGNRLIGHAGLDYRVMNLNGKPLRILGVIDLCVAGNAQSQGVGSSLLLEIDAFAEGRSIDFILLFADKINLYVKNGYQRVENVCKWLKINQETHETKGIGSEQIEGLMIKKAGTANWEEGELDLLGYLF